jgi:hypothetical protein
MIISSDASYRQLNFARSVQQIAVNAEREHDGRPIFSEEYLGLNDFSFRTPAQYRILSEEYLEIRSQVISIAASQKSEASPLSSNFDSAEIDVNKITFDRKLTEAVLDIFPMNPHEASTRDVWSYITLRILPDVAMWRYPNRSNDPEWERFIGTERNTFKRLWWRAYMLGGSLASQLDEDELVQMFERTESIGSNKRVMKTMAEFAIDSRDAMRAIGGKSSTLITETAKSLRRTMAVISYEAMSDTEIDVFVKEHAGDALNRIRASREQ